jgi:hypothetical protein
MHDEMIHDENMHDEIIQDGIEEGMPDGRWQRPPLEREKPFRNGWSGNGSAGGAGRVSEAVEETIRTAYEVIGDNFRQGHAAAERYSQETARTSADTSRDLGALTGRMIQLGRDMANTYFDAMETLLREVDRRRSDRGAPPEHGGGPQGKGVSDGGQRIQ